VAHWNGGLWRTCWIRHIHFSMAHLHTYRQASSEKQITSQLAAEWMAFSPEHVAQRGEPQSTRALLRLKVWHSRPRLCVFPNSAMVLSGSSNRSHQHRLEKERTSPLVAQPPSRVRLASKGAFGTSGFQCRDLRNCDHNNACRTSRTRLPGFNFLDKVIDHKHRRGRLCHSYCAGPATPIYPVGALCG